MRNRSKLLLAALTAALTLGALISTAGANRLALSNNAFRATWNPMVFGAGTGFGEVRCPVTIEGSFHSRTLSKNPEQLIGYVTSAIVNGARCAGGSARILTESLPWHLEYESFVGRLPRIEAVNLNVVGGKFLVRSNLLNIECLYTSTATEPMKGAVNLNTTTGVAENIRITEEPGIPKTSGPAGCPNPGKLGGTTNSLTLQGTATKITITLVQ